MSADDALAALSIDLPEWYVYGAQQPQQRNAVKATYTEMRTAAWQVQLPAAWQVQLQHRNGALLTTGTGESFARALFSAIEGAKAVERGRANARAPAPAPLRRLPALLPEDLNPEIASL